ncbi:hypothetical protein LAV_00148 [Sphingobium phage Lacusarx]|uniref:Uncharacterized protein n=1 Tax=Sphingobium phage Lacusarx TaxID=1980139 RepID=A0A1W6DX74_9CAUD|nr:hypothetical protein FDH44_gp155 [Sphingobium phage Lacusarx]ARK07523.1 hypothetical protein LAV_00148 [Sphingobium phage Lacusarx]
MNAHATIHSMIHPSTDRDPPLVPYVNIGFADGSEETREHTDADHAHRTMSQLMIDGQPIGDIINLSMTYDLPGRSSFTDKSAIPDGVFDVSGTLHVYFSDEAVLNAVFGHKQTLTDRVIETIDDASYWLDRRASTLRYPESWSIAARRAVTVLAPAAVPACLAAFLAASIASTTLGCISAVASFFRYRTTGFKDWWHGEPA